MILIAGGDEDPNLEHLIRCSNTLEIEFYPLLVGAKNNPSITWDISKEKMLIDGELLNVSSAFIRHDVFSGMISKSPNADYRASSWYTTVIGWLMTKKNIRLLNRSYAECVTNKPYVLYLAEQAGLPVPRTLVSNNFDEFIILQAKEEMIAKPVNGGSHCRHLKDLLQSTAIKEGRAASPAIVQPTLIAPEVRIFGISGVFFAFNVVADALDYRTAPHCEVTELPINNIPNGLIEGLQRLMMKMGLDFGAADFKACPETGQLLFLELNSSPMFIRFDEACNGRLSQTILEQLETGK